MYGDVGGKLGDFPAKRIWVKEIVSIHDVFSFSMVG
jgi:hypothetical protein